MNRRAAVRKAVSHRWQDAHRLVRRFGRAAGRVRENARETLVALADAAFARARVWRRLRGGHWERWYVDHPVLADVWHPVRVCIHESGRRPSGLCRGTPVCEHWR